ncbi:MAG: hypothetical protein JSR48_08160 [Verrucomicrobia bacterium]|nr:hypothetical protein [Verrucomicrobiota bacterium]
MNLQGPLLATRLAVLGLAAPMLLAGCLYLGFGHEAQREKLRLDEFVANLEAKVAQERWVDVPVPGGSGHAWLERRAMIARSDREQLDEMRLGYRMTEFRRALAEQFLVRGGWILLGLVVCHGLLVRFDQRMTATAG